MKNAKEHGYFLSRIRDIAYLWKIGLFDFDEYLASIKQLVEEREAII